MKGWQFWLGCCFLLLFSAGRSGAQGLTVISPNGGESWLGASQQTISWSYVNVDNIKIEYSLNNGLSWNLLASNYPTSALSYSWQVPAIGSTQAKVRITSSLQFIQDESNAVFTIPEPTINLIYPNGGESCATGSMQYAEWSSSGIASVVLQYSQNDGQSWQDIGTFPAANGYANWVAPASAGSVKLRAYNVENINKNDVSDGAVQVLTASLANPAKYSGSPYDGYDMSSSLPDALQLVSPNGGEVLNPYTDALIKWSFTDVNRVNLFYSINNGSSWTAIASDVPADALQYSWSVPNTPSTNCRVKVVAADVALEDISNANFTISNAFVQITYPNAGEAFTAGTMQYIEWDYNAVATVKLEYSTDNGSSWNLIGTAPAANKYANWIVPASAASGMLLRISDNAVPSLYDVSDLSLPWQTASPANPAKYSGSPYDGYSMDDNIPDSIRISSPNGGEIWMSSSTQTISWTYNHVDNISLEYTLNDGQTWQSIVSNIPASQLSYNWMVPTTPSNLCRIRVKDILRPAVTDISDNPFIIPTGAVQITYPNGGENYGTGTMQYIEWTSTGLETIKLEYSTDNGSSWNVIGTAPAANQYANWTAPLSASEQCLIRISDVGNQAVYSDVSNAAFRIFSSSPANPAKYSGSPFDGYSMYHFLDEYVKVIKPNGGEIWGNGTTHQIRWATLNNNENLKIEYSTDNEATWTTLLNDVPNTPVTFNWSIAAQPSTICKVRASTMSGSEIDKSDDFFTIANTNGIVTSAITGSQFCPGQNIQVSFSKSVNFNPGNRFIVQLSDSVGTFNGALENIGEIQSTTVQPIAVTIPQRFYTSNLYRLRVVATDPPTIGTDNGSNFSIRPLPLAKLGEDITLCSGSSRQLDVTNEGATYLWSTGATTPSITVSQAGTYSVAVTNSCGTSRDTVKVKLLSPPTVQLGPDKQICQNSVVVLEADSGASSYLWSTGATTRRINAVLAGKYVVYASNACGTSKDSINISYLPVQTLDLGSDRGLCPGNSITLNATTSNSTYLWSTGSTAASITVAQPGTYAVNVTTQCGLLSDQVTVFNGAINLSAGADVQLCRGETATLQATGANSYTWSNGQTGSIIQVSPDQTTTYTVTASNIYNCTASDQVQVQVLQSPAAPQITVQGNTSFCNGDSAVLQTSAQSGMSYEWFRNGLQVSGISGPVLTVRSSGEYQVQAENATGCKSLSSSIQITVNDGLEAPAISTNGPTTFCEGGSVSLSAPAGFTYLWSNGLTSQSISVNSTGSYTVQTIIGSCTSAVSAAVQVTVNAALETPSISTSGPTTFCEGGTVTLSAPSGFTYLWSNGSTSQTISVNSTGSYTVQTIANACTSAASQATQVSILPNPASDFTYSIQGTQVQVNPQSSIAADSLHWDFGDGQTSSDTNALHFYANPGMFNVCLTTYLTGCSSRTCKPIQISVTSLENFQGIGVQVTPNPSRGIFEISVENLRGSARMEVLDVLGKRVYEGEMSSQGAKTRQELDIRHVAMGIYTLRLQTSEGPKYLRLKKE